MCAESDTKIKGVNANLFIGYLPGRISIGDVSYNSSVDNGDRDQERLEMLNKLKSYSTHDLASLILDLVDNGEEA